MSVGVDTLNLFYINADIDICNKLKLIKKNGEYLRVYNDEIINLTLKPYSILGNNTHILTLKISVSGINNNRKHNMNKISSSEIRKVFNILSYHLKNIGIMTNIMDFRIGRIDLYKDIKVYNNPYLLNNLFYSIRIPRQTIYKHITNKTHYFNTKNTTFAIYDKKIELSEKNNIILDIPDNVTILRFEYRIIRKYNILKKTGFKTVSDLINNFTNIYYVYLRQINSVFSLTDTDFMRINKHYYGNIIKIISMKYGEYCFENKKNYKLLNNLAKKDIDKLLKRVAINKERRYQSNMPKYLVRKFIIDYPKTYFKRILMYIGYEGFIKLNYMQLIINELNEIGGEKLQYRLKSVKYKFRQLYIAHNNEPYNYIKNCLLNVDTYKISHVEKNIYF